MLLKTNKLYRGFQTLASHNTYLTTDNDNGAVTDDQKTTKAVKLQTLTAVSVNHLVIGNL